MPKRKYVKFNFIGNIIEKPGGHSVLCKDYGDNLRLSVWFPQGESVASVEPVPVVFGIEDSAWAYRGKLYQVDNTTGAGEEEIALRLKHFIADANRELDHIRIELEALAQRHKSLGTLDG